MLVSVLVKFKPIMVHPIIHLNPPLTLSEFCTEFFIYEKFLTALPGLTSITSPLAALQAHHPTQYTNNVDRAC
jgi:hypothetical protein